MKIQVRQHFHDENNYVHLDTNDVEIDIYHIKPNIIGEATLRLTDLDKVRIFIRKCEFIEKIFFSLVVYSFIDLSNFNLGSNLNRSSAI